MSVQTRYSGGTVFDHWLVGSYLGGSANHQTAVFVLTHKSCEGLRSAMKAVNLIAREGSPAECTPIQRAKYQSLLEERTNTAVQEVRLMGQLQGHPNIVGYLDHTTVDWEEDGCFGRDLLIRMELLTDLRKRMQRGEVFPESEIRKIGTDICAALTTCHQKNILHRDVKPENIFVNHNGVYKLGDFGISRILDSASNDHASTGIGTPQYASPEQFAQSYDRRADIYSLGLVLYELCNSLFYHPGYRFRAGRSRLQRQPLISNCHPGGHQRHPAGLLRPLLQPHKHHDSRRGGGNPVRRVPGLRGAVHCHNAGVPALHRLFGVQRLRPTAGSQDSQ